MKCPVCESVDLTMADRQGVEIDYCPKCRGYGNKRKKKGGLLSELFDF